MKSAGLDGSGMSDQHQTPGVDPGHAEEIMSLDWLGVSPGRTGTGGSGEGISAASPVSWNWISYRKWMDESNY